MEISNKKSQGTFIEMLAVDILECALTIAPLPWGLVLGLGRVHIKPDTKGANEKYYAFLRH